MLPGNASHSVRNVHAVALWGQERTFVSWLCLHLHGRHWANQPGAGAVSWALILKIWHLSKTAFYARGRKTWSEVKEEDPDLKYGDKWWFWEASWRRRSFGLSITLHVWLTFCFSFLVLEDSCDTVKLGWAWSHKSWVSVKALSISDCAIIDNSFYFLGAQLPQLSEWAEWYNTCSR